MALVRKLASLVLLSTSMVIGVGRPLMAQAPSAPDIYTNANIAAYRILFRRMAAYKQMTDQAMSIGQDRSYLNRSIQGRLKLGETDMMNLQIVALDCEKELAPIHAQMRAVITQYLSQFPGNVVPRGAVLSPPPELARLQASENAIIWAHRNKFKQTVTTEVFQNADIEIRQDYGNPAMNRSLLTPNGGGAK